jgi:hypothetical protein
MLEGKRNQGGTMPAELQRKVDELLDQFVAMVDAVSEERHLQRGIARSLLPCSIAAILDGENLFLVAQLRSENLFSVYVYTPETTWLPDKVMNNASWEFGFEDPFLLQFPAGLLEASEEERREDVRRLATEHVDSEFKRFMSRLSLLRTRPIFGSAPSAVDARSAFLLLPSPWGSSRIFEAVSRAAEANRLYVNVLEEIRAGRSAIRGAWISINESRVVIADLTGPDPGVMYALGMAHTVGKETVLIYPKGSSYLVDLPKILRIEYEENEDGAAKVERELSAMLAGLIQPIIPP